MRKASLAILLMFIFTAIGTRASEPDVAGSDIMELPLEENLIIPKVSRHNMEAVKRAAIKLQTDFGKLGFKTELLRDGEVVMLTLPADKVFAVATDAITPGGKNLIFKLTGIASRPDLYKILIAVHSDDSGDDEYSYRLTEDRANAIDEMLFEMTSSKSTNVVPYGMGKDEPLTNNHSRAERAENRRVEIYLVPGGAWSKD